MVQEVRKAECEVKAGVLTGACFPPRIGPEGH